MLSNNDAGCSSIHVSFRLAASPKHFRLAASNIVFTLAASLKEFRLVVSRKHFRMAASRKDFRLVAYGKHFRFYVLFLRFNCKKNAQQLNILDLGYVVSD